MALHDPLELDEAEAKAFLKLRTAAADKKRADTLRKIDDYVKSPPFKSSR